MNVLIANSYFVLPARRPLLKLIWFAFNAALSLN
jgi:hypothetical protein